MPMKQRRTKTIPVIVVTNLDERDKLVAVEWGAIDYLVKAETSLEKLKARVDGVLGG